MYILSVQLKPEPFGSTVMSSIEENWLAPFKGKSEFAPCVKADLNWLLQMSHDMRFPTM